MDSGSGITDSPVSVNNDEKMFALFAHLSILLGGIVIPIVFWLTNKEKSKFVTYHSLQALWFHIALIIFAVILALLIISLSFGFIFTLPAISYKGSQPPFILIILIIVIYGLIYLTLISFIIYGIYAAVKSYEGKLVRYPVIGKIIYRKVYGE
jgi:hypothetical protein